MLLTEFNLANPLYAHARVWVYEVDTSDWTITTTLAPIYQGPLGSGWLGNPLTLDSDGKWWRAAFVDRPVILRITNAQVPSHDTGITGLQSTFMGDWAAGETYLPGQIVRDGADGSDTGNLYTCQENHTSAAWVADLTAERWLLYLEAGSGTGGSDGTGSREYTLPEDFGAVGDGVGRTPRSYLGITSGAALRAYNDGVWSFASSDDVDAQIDWLAWQAAIYAGGMVRGWPKAEYKIDKTLIIPNGCVNVDATGCRLMFYDIEEAGSGAELLVNPDLNGQTGWTQGLLQPNPPYIRTDVVFGADKATFTDPVPNTLDGNGNIYASYGDFGQNVILPAGKWTIRIEVQLFDGASHGLAGPPYMNMGFSGAHIGQGNFEWPHPLASAGAFNIPGEFNGIVSFDAEVLEDTNCWLSIQGGNCDWEVRSASIKPYRMNYAFWCAGDDLGFPQTINVTTWRGGEIYGPVSGGTGEGFTGPTIGGFLHKGFRGGDKRCHLDGVFMRGFDVGATYASQAYLNIMMATNIGWCRTCVKYEANSINAGENMRVHNCVFFNSGLAFHAEGGGEWNFFGNSFDYCQRSILLERGAKVTMVGHHCEFEGAEMRLYLTSPTGSWAAGSIVTGGTSGASGRVIVDRSNYAQPYVILEISIYASAEFADGEGLTSTAGGVASADGEVFFTGYSFELKGGSLLDYGGEFLQSGGAHRGAHYMFNLETNMDTISCTDWWAYGLRTVSNTLCTGAGRFLSRNFLGPGNANLPAMIMRNLPSDIYAGNGRIYGPGSMHDMGYMEFANQSDGIGLTFGSYSQTQPNTRGLTAWEQWVQADNTVYTAPGYGSLKLEYNAIYSGYARLVILVPVQPGDVIFDEYKISKPASKPPVVIGPFTSAADPNQIWVNTRTGSSIVTIQDNQARSIGDGFGPAAGWTVDVAGVTGNPGGIANAVWNATHTLVSRINTGETGDVLYTVDLGSGNEASSTVADAGGSAVQTTYGQTNILMFDTRFWVKVQNFDSVGRPIIEQSAYQGEDNFRFNHATVDWTLRQSVSHYTAAVIPRDEPSPGVFVPAVLTENRYGNGRAPVWATHYAHVITWSGIRFQDPADPPLIYLTDFFGNKL